MKVLILHNLYQQPGGEDVVARSEATMLQRAGHDVTLESVSNDAIRTLGDKARAMARTAYDPTRVEWTRRLIDRHRPDVLHVHNFFPLLTPAVHETAKEQGVAVVQTLHNYRLLCAAASFEREGKVCESCLSGSRANALLHRCYRGSLPGTAALVALQRRAIGQQFLPRNVDLFVALTEFARRKYVEGGLPAEKIAVKPNFVDRPAPPPFGNRRGALFVGRLSPEKGLGTLVSAWRSVPDVPLTIAGDGPLRAELESVAPANVRFLGQVDSSQVQAEMNRASLLIVPSVWYEGFPMAIVEAFASGLPALASRIGSLAEIVEDGAAGAHCAPGDPDALAATVRELFSRPERLEAMGRTARRIYDERYTQARNLTMLEECYGAAIEARQRLAA